mmetsp:Transcript_400/g.930  ORF Transcript_400/g.930 Transcript_400/m.930 type:complete len:141 (-) Transcript_400:761-1183(-)
MAVLPNVPWTNQGVTDAKGKMIMGICTRDLIVPTTVRKVLASMTPQIVRPAPFATLTNQIQDLHSAIHFAVVSSADLTHYVQTVIFAKYQKASVVTWIAICLNTQKDQTLNGAWIKIATILQKDVVAVQDAIYARIIALN